MGYTRIDGNIGIIDVAISQLFPLYDHQITGIIAIKLLYHLKLTTIVIVVVVVVVVAIMATIRRKFRSQTSDNMDRWKSRGGKSQRGEAKK